MNEHQQCEYKQVWKDEFLLKKHPSRPFNPLIAATLFRAGFIESWGRGIEKISHACRTHGIEAPDYNYEMSGLMLTFSAKRPATDQQTAREKDLKKNQKWGEKWGEKWGPSMTAKRLTLVRCMLLNPSVSTQELAVLLKMSTSGVEKHLKVLLENGCIRYVGPAKGGHWEVLK